MNSEQRQVLQDEGFITGPEIGKGTYGTVFRCTHADTHINYAVKVIDLKLLKMRPNFDLEKLLREVHVMQQLNHPNIVRLYSVLQSPNYVLLIMELVLGVELFELIMAKNGLSEDAARPIFYQLCLALLYMHSKGIIHRDIKPENILLQGGMSVALPSPDGSDASTPGIKLVDFGLSKILGTEGSGAKSIVGTPRYIAPEISSLSHQDQMERKHYGTSIDCYSAGVLLHVTLGACFPQFVKENGVDRVVFQDPRISKISENAKDLIAGLMHPNVAERMTIEDASKHKWFEGLVPEEPVPEVLRKISARETQPYEEFVEHLLEKAKAGNNAIQAGQQETPKGLTTEQLQSLHHLQNLQAQYEAANKSLRTPESGAPVVSHADKMPRPLLPKFPDSVPKKYFTESEHQERFQNMTPSKSILDAPARLKRRAATGELGPSSAEEHAAEFHSPSHDGSSSPSVRPSIVSQVMDSMSGLPAADVTKVDTEESIKMTVESTADSGHQDNSEVGAQVAEVGKTNVFMGQVQQNTNVTAIIDPAQLLSLQCQIAECFRESWVACKDDQDVAPAIRKSAVASRDLMQQSSWLLKKLEQTSISVSDLLPDLMIAVEEGEFAMAFTCFKTIKGWIGILKNEATALLERNLEVMNSVNDSIELARSRNNRLNRVTNALESMVLDQRKTVDQNYRRQINNSVPDSEQGLKNSQLKQLIGVVNDAITTGETVSEEQVLDLGFPNVNVVPVNGLTSPTVRRTGQFSYMDSQESSRPSSSGSVPGSAHNEDGSLVARQSARPNSPSQHMTQALDMLKQVDELLQHHASFWSQMEVVVDVLMQRAEHIEGMINFTRNPRLHGRFKQRMTEYEKMWQHVLMMCDRFSIGKNPIGMYKFLN